MKLAPAIALAFGLVVAATLTAYAALVIGGHPRQAGALGGAGGWVAGVLAVATFFAWVLED